MKGLAHESDVHPQGDVVGAARDCRACRGCLVTNVGRCCRGIMVRDLTYAPTRRIGEQRAPSASPRSTKMPLPRVLDAMHNTDALVCANMQHALWLLAKRWGVADPRTQRMLGQCHEQFADFSLGGAGKDRDDADDAPAARCPKPLPPRLTNLVSEIPGRRRRRRRRTARRVALVGRRVDRLRATRPMGRCVSRHGGAARP